MNILKLGFLLIMALATSSYGQNLSDYQWTNRIIILSDQEQDFSKAKEALETLSAFDKELKERDLLIFIHRDGKRYDTNFKMVNKDIGKSIPKNFIGYFLIGKDGRIKSQKPYPIDPVSIFTLIDGMPMRRAEIKSDN